MECQLCGVCQHDSLSTLVNRLKFTFSDSAYDSDAYDPVKTRLPESQAKENKPITMPISAYDSDNLVFIRS